MKFSSRKRRQAPTIIIISLIDILIVLLIFLMVTTTFKHQPSFRLVLPETKQARQGTSDKTHSLVLMVDKKEPYFYLGSSKLAMTSDRLQEELNTSVAKDPALSISLWPDKEAPVGQVLKAWELAKSSGCTNVELAVKKSGAK